MRIGLRLGFEQAAPNERAAAFLRHQPGALQPGQHGPTHFLAQTGFFGRVRGADCVADLHCHESALKTIEAVVNAEHQMIHLVLLWCVR